MKLERTEKRAVKDTALVLLVCHLEFTGDGEEEVTADVHQSNRLDLNQHTRRCLTFQLFVWISALIKDVKV